MENRAFVLNHNRQPLMPCHPARARQLLREGKAAVFRHSPFTIILQQPTTDYKQPVTAKFDPGSQTTGMAVVAKYQRGQVCVWAANLNHRGHQVKEALQSRRAIRRSRRNRHTRYRKSRFQNRTRRQGWLAPSLQSRVQNIAVWAKRLQQYLPLTNMACEVVRFDTHKLQHPEIAGIEYQQGTLFGYEVREFLLEKWNWTCVYCQKKDVPLQIEHLLSKKRGGTDRISNLGLACGPCNQKKGSQTAAEYGFPELMEKAKQPLKDAAAVNSIRFAMLEVLQTMGLPVETGSGGQTKYNRTTQNYPKQHWIDAACVGTSGGSVLLHPKQRVLEIKAMGRGSRQMCRMDKYGFPRTSAKARSKQVHGFQTGDLVEAMVTKGKKTGRYVGRVAVRSSGSFNIKTKAGVVQGISHKACRLLQKTDGYAYHTTITSEQTIQQPCGSQSAKSGESHSSPKAVSYLGFTG